MENGRSQFVICTLCVVFGAGLIFVDAQKVEKGYCSRDSIDSLEKRVSDSDVIITGTVIQVAPENLGEHRTEVLDGGSDELLSDAAKAPANSPIVGFVRVWRVVKGSLGEVTNFSMEQEDIMSRASFDVGAGEEIGHPVLKLYGLWNDMTCGSFVNINDTRIFFLRKFRDVREIFENMNSPANRGRSEPKKLPIVKTSGNGKEAPSRILDTKRLVADSSLLPKKGKKRGKGKRKDRKRGKSGKRRKNRKLKTRSVVMKKKKRRPKKRVKRKTESYSSWLQKIFRESRAKRSAPRKVTIKDHKLERRQATRSVENEESRYVLVLHSTPARITLKNLNKVENLSKDT